MGPSSRIARAAVIGHVERGVAQHRPRPAGKIQEEAHQERDSEDPSREERRSTQATTTNFAARMAPRGVGTARRSLTVLSANSRPNTQAVTSAKMNDPPTAVAWAITPRNVGQSAVPAVICAFVPSRPMALARAGSFMMNMNSPPISGASENPAAVQSGTLERRAFRISQRSAATSSLTSRAPRSLP